MRIALDARKLTGMDSGIGSYSENLARALLEEDQELELLLVCTPSRRPRRWPDPRVQEVCVPFPALSPFTQLTLGPWLRRQVFDVFHAPFDVAPRWLGRPLVVTVHDLNWFANPRYNSHYRLPRLVEGTFFRYSLAAAMQEASRLLAVSHATRRAILAHAPWHEAKIRVVYNGIDRQRFYPVDQAVAYRTLVPLVEPGTPFVLTVGQGVPYKNHLHAVRGFLEAFGDRPEYRLILVRRVVRQDPALDAVLHSPQGKTQVRVLPYVTPAILNALYNTARIVLHPPTMKGSGSRCSRPWRPGPPS
jgi:glycosyltransferase involved in cell wall biosynthesis